MKVSREELVGYYATTKSGELTNYDTRDLFNVLTHKLYTELPFNISQAVFQCLHNDYIIHRMYAKLGYRKVSNWAVEIWDIETRNQTRTEFETIHELPFNQMPIEEYEEFFSYYANAMVDDYYTRIINMKMMVKRKAEVYEYTAPLEFYKNEMRKMGETMYYYTGKFRTDNVLRDFTDEFLSRLTKTEYHNKYTKGDIDDAVVNSQEEYNKMRKRTRLNKGETIPMGKS